MLHGRRIPVEDVEDVEDWQCLYSEQYHCVEPRWTAHGINGNLRLQRLSQCPHVKPVVSETATQPRPDLERLLSEVPRAAAGARNCSKQ